MLTLVTYNLSLATHICACLNGMSIKEHKMLINVQSDAYMHKG